MEEISDLLTDKEYKYILLVDFLISFVIFRIRYYPLPKNIIVFQNVKFMHIKKLYFVQINVCTFSNVQTGNVKTDISIFNMFGHFYRNSTVSKQEDDNSFSVLWFPL